MLLWSRLPSAVFWGAAGPCSGAPARLLQMACLEGLAVARLLDCPFESDLTTTSHPSQITQLPLIIKSGHV